VIRQLATAVQVPAEITLLAREHMVQTVREVQVAQPVPQVVQVAPVVGDVSRKVPAGQTEQTGLPVVVTVPVVVLTGAVHLEQPF